MPEEAPTCTIFHINWFYLTQHFLHQRIHFMKRRVIIRKMITVKKFPKLLAALAAVMVLSVMNWNTTNQSDLSSYRRLQDEEDTIRLLREDNIRVAAAELGDESRPATLLLGIFSTTGEKYSHRRVYIRDTYLGTGNPKICKLSEFIRQTTEDPMRRVCEVPYTFVIGAGGPDRPHDHDDSEPLTLDMDPYGNSEDDCTYLNIRENMENGKSPTYLKFAANLAEEYGIDYVAKSDDDSVISPWALLEFIEEDLPPSPHNRRIYGGAPRLSRLKNHIYAAGEFYMMSSDLANYVGNVLTPAERLGMMIPRKPTEDLDMGTFVHGHPRAIKFLNMNSRKIWIHPKKTELEFLESWTGGQALMLPKRHGCQLTWKSFCTGVLSGKSL